MTEYDGTIAAIATPPGSGGLSVIRVSGPDAVVIADRVFRGSLSLADVATWTAHFGRAIGQDGEIIDQVICLVMRAPKSFTGDDTVEFSLHGGWYLTQCVLEVLLDAGARLAEPGEFSRRAYLNGKMDLTQAEAVADLIAAGTDRERRVALEKLRGGLRQRLMAFRDILLGLLAQVEAEIDFSEEDVIFLQRDTALTIIRQLRQDVCALLGTSREGHLLRDGAIVGLFGRVNVGKSSLLNALTETDRAIVTDTPGTTRDTIDSEIVYRGIRFRLIDTAGIRASDHHIESEGVARSRRLITEVDIAVLILDATEIVTDEDTRIFAELQKNTATGAAILVCVNKMDLCGHEKGKFKSIALKLPQSDILYISAKEGTGLGGLKDKLLAAVSGGQYSATVDLIITSQRQQENLKTCADLLDALANRLKNDTGPEFLAEDMRAPIDALDSIMGKEGMEDVLDAIFSRFCIGK